MTPGMLRSVNPATGEELASYPEHTAEELDQALAAADSAQRAWAQTSFAERRRCLEEAARLLREGRDGYARLATREMGKPIAEAGAELDKCAWSCEFYAERAERFLADEPVQTDALSSYVAYQPLGVVLAIMPWNFPFWQVLRFAAPALMAGNGALLKHSPNVPGCALAIEELFARAGFPPGLFRTLLVGDVSVAEATGRLLADPRVGAVTLTGSERAGSAVGATAGRALKKCVLELGGSDPFLVLADADLPLAAEAAARADLLTALERQVEGSVAAGATVLLGGGRLPGPGWFHAPTVLAGVTPDMPVFREETFGPVAAVIRAGDEDAAVELANDTPYGLGASVWTRDLDKAQRLGRRIESGSLFVNAVVASDPRLPFGGVKRSGFGRELAAVGIREFTNIRAFWVQPADAAPPATLAE